MDNIPECYIINKNKWIDHKPKPINILMNAIENKNIKDAQLYGAEFLCDNYHNKMIIYFYKYYISTIYKKNLSIIINIFKFHELINLKKKEKVKDLYNDQQIRNHLSTLISTLILYEPEQLPNPTIITKSNFPCKNKDWEKFIDAYNSKNISEYKTYIKQFINNNDNTFWEWLETINPQYEIFKEVIKCITKNSKSNVDDSVSLIIISILCKSNTLKNYNINNPKIDKYCLQINFIYKSIQKTYSSS